MLFFKKLFFLIIIVSFLTTFGCNFKNKQNHETYIIDKKYLDEVYMRQSDRLEQCIYDLPPQIYERIEEYKKTWSTRAVLDVKRTMSERDCQRFDYRKYIEIIAEHNAKRFICAEFEIAFDEEDKLVEYAVLEYEECIKKKNSLYINSMIFKRPQIGAGRLPA